MINAVKKAVLVLSGLSLGLLLFAFWQLHTTRGKATSFVAEFAALKAGDKAENAHALYERYKGGYAAVSGNCTSVKCEYHFGFTNFWLRFTRMVPARGLGASIFISDGAIRTKRLMLSDDSHASLIVNESDCYPCSAASEAYRVSTGPMGWLVEITPATHPSDRQVAYQFNADLVTSFRKLRSGRDLNPALWDAEHQKHGLQGN